MESIQQIEEILMVVTVLLAVMVGAGLFTVLLASALQKGSRTNLHASTDSQHNDTARHSLQQTCHTAVPSAHSRGA